MILRIENRSGIEKILNFSLQFNQHLREEREDQCVCCTNGCSLNEILEQKVKKKNKPTI